MPELNNSHLERHLEAFFRKRVRMLGGYTVKLAPTERGMPDRLVMMPGGRMFFVELKTKNGIVSPLQKVWHDRMRALGSPVYVLYGEDEVVAWLRRVISATDPRKRPGRKPRAKVS